MGVEQTLVIAPPEVIRALAISTRDLCEVEAAWKRITRCNAKGEPERRTWASPIHAALRTGNRGVMVIGDWMKEGSDYMW